MELPVRNIKGEQVDTVQVSDSLFDTAANAPVVHQAMVMYLANMRQGTHDTKTRSEVSGGGRKPWRQKYTGRARQGSTRSPQWRHGGIVFGPHPRSYRQAMPKKMRHLALCSVLSDKARGQKLVLVDNLDMAQAKTRDLAVALESLGIAGSALLVTQGKNEGLVRSARNLPQVYTLPVDLLNASILLKKESLVMTLDAVRRAETLWGKSEEPAEAPVDTSEGEEE